MFKLTALPCMCFSCIISYPLRAATQACLGLLGLTRAYLIHPEAFKNLPQNLSLPRSVFHLIWGHNVLHMRAFWTDFGHFVTSGCICEKCALIQVLASFCTFKTILYSCSFLFLHMCAFPIHLPVHFLCSGNQLVVSWGWGFRAGRC